MKPVQAPQILTFLTDFGTRDPYVGVMKGIVFQSAPFAQIVDITHEISPQDVGEAAFWVHKYYKYFPTDTVHVCVVDPGVGTSRPALFAKAHGQYFVAPDNGLLADVMATDPGAQVRRIDQSRFARSNMSSTFHGRDLFSPAAARFIGENLTIEQMGDACDFWVPSPIAQPVFKKDEISGTIVTVDRFGNLLTNLERKDVPSHFTHVSCGTVTCSVVDTYANAKRGEVAALFGGFEVLELAICQGNAAQSLGLGKGDTVVVRKLDTE
jgi:S-adenosyl-L-methionine hydrolase (adenosine-forming)